MEADPRAAAAAGAGWAQLSSDVTDLILARLPLRSLVRAAAVCRHWRAAITNPTFAAAAATSAAKPWFFLHGHHTLLRRNSQTFAYDPDFDRWALLPSSPLHVDCFSGSGGLSFAIHSSASLSFSPLLRPATCRRLTSPLSFPRCNPLVAVLPSTGPHQPKLIVVGGARFVGGLVDIEDRLAVEIYDPATDTWDLCPPLPPSFRSGNSSQWLTAALLSTPRLFFVFGIYSCLLSAFDVDRRAWTRVQVLRPPGVLFSFLLASRDRLILAGLCSAADGGPPVFTLWDVDYRSMEYSQIGVMPNELLSCTFDGDDDDTKFAGLKCVGLDGLVYVFNDDHHKGYPACVGEIGHRRGGGGGGGGGGGALTCSWRKLPALPGPVNRFHKVMAFCSEIPLHSVLGGSAAAAEE